MSSEDQALTLGLGFPSSPKPNNNYYSNHPFNLIKTVKPPTVEDHVPCLTLTLSGDTYLKPPPERKVEAEPPCSAASSLSNTPNVVVSVKRERETASSEDLESDRGCSRGSDEEEDGSGPTTGTRKKLRLTKEQSALLEESFKQHSTLNPKQKQELADGLNLRPRQVEVWFQNRRARTKLKQTEVDCEYLKKCCETLTDENRRLQKELQELKALKVTPQPLYMHLPSATLTMCPSCERIVPIAAGSTASKTPFDFYSSFSNPSAAC